MNALHSAGQLHVVFVQDTKAVDVSGVPWLGFAAEVENGSVFNHPIHIADAGASQKIIVIIAGIIIPEGIVYFQDMSAIEAVEDILVGQQELLAVFFGKGKKGLGLDELPAFVQIHQKNTGIEIVMIGSQADLIDTVGQFCFSGMSGCGKEMIFQVQIPEGTQWIDHQDIRIQIEDSVKLFWKKVCGQQAVIHFPGVSFRNRCVPEGRWRNLDWKKTKTKRLTLFVNECQIVLWDAAVEKI